MITYEYNRSSIQIISCCSQWKEYVIGCMCNNATKCNFITFFFMIERSDESFCAHAMPAKCVCVRMALQWDVSIEHRHTHTGRSTPVKPRCILTCCLASNIAFARIPMSQPNATRIEMCVCVCARGLAGRFFSVSVRIACRLTNWIECGGWMQSVASHTSGQNMIAERGGHNFTLCFRVCCCYGSRLDIGL